MARIPITLLSGYLGAGKTTLVNRLLAAPGGRRLGVLVNDFGAVNVDAALIEGAEDGVLSLADGCVCCVVSDDLGQALDTLLARANPPEHVLLEASGVADPARIARLAGGWPGFELDAVVTLADAETLPARAADRFVGQLVRSQLQVADLVALTRTDLLEPARAEATRERIRALAPNARLLDAPHGALDADLLLGPRLVAGAQPQMPARPGQARPQGACGPAARRHDHDLSSLRTALWRPAGAVDPAGLAAALGALPEAIHRAKGVLLASDGARLLAQRVGARATVSPAPAGSESLAPGLVLIAAGHPELLDATLRAAFETLDRTPLTETSPR